MITFKVAALNEADVCRSAGTRRGVQESKRRLVVVGGAHTCNEAKRAAVSGNAAVVGVGDPVAALQTSLHFNCC